MKLVILGVVTRLVTVDVFRGLTIFLEEKKSSGGIMIT
jgi:hypothetical protein